MRLNKIIFSCMFFFVVFLFGCKTTDNYAVIGVQELPPQLDKPVEKPKKDKKVKVDPKLKFAKQLNHLLENQKYEEALKLFESEPALTNSLQMQNLRLATMISAEKFDDAKSLADILVKKYPNNTDVLYSKAVLSGVSGDDKKKAEYINKVLKIDPNNKNALMEKGFDDIYKKRYDSAKKSFIQVLKIEPTEKDALLGLAQIEYWQGDLEKSEKYLNKLVDLGINNAEVFALRSGIYFENRKVLKAIEDINKAIKLDPNVPSYYMDLGAYCTRAGRTKDALNAYTNAIKLDPNNYIAYIYRGGINEKLNNKESAIKDYKVVCELYPQYYFAAESLGVLFFQKEQWKESKKYFLKALEYDADNVYYALMVTICDFHANDIASGKKFMSEYLKYIDRNNEKEAYFLSRLFVEQVGESSVERMIYSLKDKAKKNRLRFYLAKFYELVRKSKVAEKLYLEMGLENPTSYESVLAEYELKKRNIVPRVK